MRSLDSQAGCDAQIRDADREGGLFRLWIATYADWHPGRWNDPPPQATAVELVADTTYSAAEARRFLEGFNSQIVSTEQPLWVVAIPVALRYEGDAVPGDRIHGHRFSDQPL
jgi:hypothetical protein